MVRTTWRGPDVGGVRAVAAIEKPVFPGAMALLGAFGALRWHGWLHMEVNDLVMFFFLANLFFDRAGHREPVEPGIHGHGGRSGCSGCWTRTGVAGRSGRETAADIRAAWNSSGEF